MKASIRISIKTKLFLLFAGTLAAFILAGMLFSTLFLQSFYISESKKNFESTAEQVAAILSGSRDQTEATIQAIDHTEAISITVADGDKVVEYTSYPRKQKDGTAKLPKEILALIDGGDGKTAYGQVSAGDGGAARIAYAAQSGTGEWIVLTRQLKGVAESAAIANRFFLITGLAALVLGGGVIYLYARRIVRPVQEMNEAARDIANLKFDTITDIRSNDELGELAASINVISEKLRSSIDSLKQDVAYQKQLTRDTSHELKTPIAVIKGYAEGLIFNVADNPESIREYCQTIVTECDWMDGLVRDMLELSSLESGHGTLEKSVFTAETLLADTVADFSPLFEDQGIHAVWGCPGDLSLEADYGLLKRALGNFVTNGVRYGDTNHYIRLSARAEGERVRLSVYNTGPGVAEAELPQIWDAFYKVDKSHTREGGGHGLGLAIVKSIAQRHGGTVDVQNQRGGIEFSIIL